MHDTSWPSISIISCSGEDDIHHFAVVNIRGVAKRRGSISGVGGDIPSSGVFIIANSWLVYIIAKKK